MEHPDHVLWWISPPEYESLVVQKLVDELPDYIKRSLKLMLGTQGRGRVHVDLESPADVADATALAGRLEWPNHEFRQYLRRWCAGIVVRGGHLQYPALCVGVVTDLELQRRFRLPWLTPNLSAGRIWVDLEERP